MVDQEEPDLLQQVACAEEEKGEAEEDQAVGVPAPQRGRGARLADSDPIGARGAEVIEPERAEHDGGEERAGDRGAIERRAKRETECILHNAAHIDGQCDAGGHQHDIYVEAADRGGALVGTAPCQTLRDPPVNAPDREAHKGNGTESGVGVPDAGERRGGIQDLVDGGRAEVDQPDQQHPEAGGGDNIDVEAALDHLTGPRPAMGRR